MFIYTRVDSDSDEVLVTFVQDAILNQTTMTKQEYINYVKGIDSEDRSTANTEQVN